jgi:hypothetical protein
MVGRAGGQRRPVQMEGGWPGKQQVDGKGQCRLCSGTRRRWQGRETEAGRAEALGGRPGCPPEDSARSGGL